MKPRIPRWKVGLGALGVAGLLGGGIGMSLAGTATPPAAHAQHSAVRPAGEGWTAHPAMYYDVYYVGHNASIIGD